MNSARPAALELSLIFNELSGPTADPLPPAAAAQLHRRLRPTSLGRATKSQLLEIYRC